MVNQPQQLVQARFPVGKSKLFLGLLCVSPALVVCVSKLFSSLASLVSSEGKAGDPASPILPTGHMGISELSISSLTLVEIVRWL